MKILKKKRKDNAVVGVVTAILLVGLIVAVVSLVQTMYIPKIMEQREAEHMDKVAEQFTYLSSVINGQAANPTNQMSVATSITLGSKELPYLLSIRAYGTIEILDNNERTMTITGDTSPTIPIGVITYSSNNGYFLDQTYTYEAGAMIVSQSDGNLMMVPPSFFVDDSGDIHFHVVNIVSVGQKTIGSGFGTYPILTQLRDNSSESPINGVSDIRINTPLSNAWRVFIKNTLNEAGLIENTHYRLNSETDPYVNINFTPTVTVMFKTININAQIGPGWVEQ